MTIKLISDTYQIYSLIVILREVAGPKKLLLFIHQ